MQVDEKLIHSICATISRGNSVNRILPLRGKIVMDQLLPFLCVYRYAQKPDYLFTQLVKTQAAYLIVDDRVSIKALLRCIATVASEKFNSFLIIELWSDPNPASTEFEILCPEKRAPATIKALTKGLKEISAIYPTLSVQVVDINQRHPKHLDPLFFIDETKELGSLLIGLRVPPVYKEKGSGNPFALFLRKFRAQFSEAIKKGVFEFTRVQTSKEFNHYLMLGKTQLTNLIRFTDRQLADISEKMNFLLRITPVNTAQEWVNFKKHNFDKEPAFNYRLISIDPELEKRNLYKIRVERIEDPTLAYIFRDKRLELEKQLTMLEERGTKNFRYIGQSLYGVVDDKDVQTAKNILNFSYEEHGEPQTLDCHDFARHAQKEIDEYKNKFPDLDLKIQIRKDVSGVMVSKCHLLISEDFSMPVTRVEALIQHEVGTHILSYCNGRQQPLHQMYAGLAGYDQLQEGLAVLAEYLANGLTPGRLKTLAGRVRAVDCMLNGADFIETFRTLIKHHNFEEKTAYTITMRVFRGGGLTKDAVYLTGLIHLLQYIQNGGSLEILYSGKFHLKHVPIIKELLHRKVLNAPFLSPYFQTESVQKRLKDLQHIKNITELLNTKQHDHRLHN